MTTTVDSIILGLTYAAWVTAVIMYLMWVGAIR